MRIAIIGLALAAAAGTASVEVKPLGKSTVTGSLTLKQVATGVEVTGELRGLAPNTTHGFHVHEKGDCSAADGSSAGGHWNPAGHEHGAPSATSHAGDLGNVMSDAKGVAVVKVLKPGATLTGPEGLIGHAVIVHEGADDLKTQPTGNSGARVACGVVSGT